MIRLCNPRRAATRHRVCLVGLGLACVVPILTGSSASAATTKAHRVPRLDLADTAAGTYIGNVISDARGGERQTDVTITVKKTAPNTVSVSSSIARLPTFTARLLRAMQTVQNINGGSTVFLLNLAKTPRRLDITIDDASWSGDKQ